MCVMCVCLCMHMRVCVYVCMCVYAYLYVHKHLYCTIRYNSIVFLYRRAVQYPVILDVSEFITYSITTGSYLDWLLQSCCIETGFVAIQLFQQG